MGRKKKPVNWKKYPVRRCYSIQYCDLCGGVIVIGDEYYDGGNGRRAHVDCVENREMLYSKLEEPLTEQADQFGLMLETIDTLNDTVEDLKNRVYELEREVERKANKDDMSSHYDEYGNSKRDHYYDMD